MERVGSFFGSRVERFDSLKRVAISFTTLREMRRFWKPRDVLAYMHKRYGLFQTQSEWEGRDSFPNTADKTESQAIWSAVMKDAEN